MCDRAAVCAAAAAAVWRGRRCRWWCRRAGGGVVVAAVALAAATARAPRTPSGVGRWCVAGVGVRERLMARAALRCHGVKGRGVSGEGRGAGGGRARGASEALAVAEEGAAAVDGGKGREGRQTWRGPCRGGGGGVAAAARLARARARCTRACLLAGGRGAAGLRARPGMSEEMPGARAGSPADGWRRPHCVAPFFFCVCCRLFCLVVGSSLWSPPGAFITARPAVARRGPCGAAAAPPCARAACARPPSGGGSPLTPRPPRGVVAHGRRAGGRGRAGWRQAGWRAGSPPAGKSRG